jgi:hypothetical protein
MSKSWPHFLIGFGTSWRIFRPGLPKAWNDARANQEWWRSLS